MSSVPVKEPEFGPIFEKKFLSIFKKFNVAGDGKIKKSDYEAWADRYVEIGKLDGVKAKQVRRKIVKIYNDYLSESATNDEVDEQTFMQALRAHKERLLETVLQFMELLFDLVDLSGDGVIQKDEYALFLKVFRVDDPKVAEEHFNMIDTNGNGTLSHDEFVYAGCEYFLKDDDSPASYLFGPIL